MTSMQTWRRDGVLLAPPFPMPWARTHAALPIVDDGESDITVYFSPRDDDGRAQIARAHLESWTGTPSYDPEPVVTHGPLGAYDDAGVTASCLVRHEGRLFLYLTGWSLARAVPFTFFAGLAVSDDGGRTFGKVSPAPILERSAVDPYLTASPWVIVEDGRWRMWYVSGTEWQSGDGGPRHRYLIKYAESSDGIGWDRSGHVCVGYASDDEYAFGRPCVVRDGELYRMWFSSRGDAYRLSYAESADGVTWNRADVAVKLGGSPVGDAEMQTYPVVVDRDGVRSLLYNGDGYGRTGILRATLEGA